MKLAAFALAAVACAAAAPTLAAGRATDVAFMRASRCKALADALGHADAARLGAFLKGEESVRSAAVIERAQAEAQRARRDARSVDRRDRLAAELAGPCAAYTGASKAAAAD